eukprot:6203108-Pleurochrysis_carterae.AAC.1
MTYAIKYVQHPHLVRPWALCDSCDNSCEQLVCIAWAFERPKCRALDRSLRAGELRKDRSPLGAHRAHAESSRGARRQPGRAAQRSAAGRGRWRGCSDEGVARHDMMGSAHGTEYISTNNGYVSERVLLLCGTSVGR